MSARATDDIGNLVRRLSRLLNRKVSDVIMLLFNHKTAGSLGAVAGFAIAVVFASKLLRSPSGMPRRNAQKRRITPSTSQPPGGFGSSSEGLAPVLEMKVSDAAEAISAPIQLSPGQIVKKKLSGPLPALCRVWNCGQLGLVFIMRLLVGDGGSSSSSGHLIFVWR